MSTLVRSVRPDDVPAVVELVHELARYERAPDECHLTTEQLHRALFGPQPALFGHVGEIDGVVCGFALWFLNYSTWDGVHGIYLEDLYVRPQCRRSGLGRALLAELGRICVERGYSRLQWWVLNWNALALDFYRSIGAQPMDEWTVWRVTGDALVRLGRPADPAPS